jgi:uncharacterized membrane-anchored protein YjiN (DUF445 family)
LHVGKYREFSTARASPKSTDRYRAARHHGCAIYLCDGSMPHLLDAINDRDVREYLGDALGRQLGNIDLAPIFGRAITILTARGSHESLIDRFLDQCREFLTNREDQLYAAEIQRRRKWIPKAVNRQIARVIIGGVKEVISKLREPGGAARQKLAVAQLFGRR